MRKTIQSVKCSVWHMHSRGSKTGGSDFYVVIDLLKCLPGVSIFSLSSVCLIAYLLCTLVIQSFPLFQDFPVEPREGCLGGGWGLGEGWW